MARKKNDNAVAWLRFGRQPYLERVADVGQCRLGSDQLLYVPVIDISCFLADQSVIDILSVLFRIRQILRRQVLVSRYSYYHRPPTRNVDGLFQLLEISDGDYVHISLVERRPRGLRGGNPS